MVKKTTIKEEEVKEEFDDFARKVSKMESLKDELEAMDTTGFEKEVRVIRAKMKNVDSTSEVERDIDKLKEKILEPN